MDKKLSYLIAYYSGTGSTEMVADRFAENLKEIGTVIMDKITNGNSISNDTYDMLFLIFPVHAFNAPKPVY